VKGKNGTSAASKIIPPILFCQPMTSEVDAGDTAVEVEPSRQYSIIFCYCVTDGSRGADKMASDMGGHMKPRCVTEFLHV